MLSSSSSSSSSSLQLDPSIYARLWGFFFFCARVRVCMYRITHHLWNLDPLWFLRIIFHQHSFYAELFALLRTLPGHLKETGLFRANNRVAFIRTESFSSLFFRARHIIRCHDGERMSPHIACQVSLLGLHDHNNRYRAFKRTLNYQLKLKRAEISRLRVLDYQEDTRGSSALRFYARSRAWRASWICRPETLWLYVLILNPTSLPSWCFDAVHFCFTNMMKWQPRKKVSTRSDLWECYVSLAVDQEGKTSGWTWSWRLCGEFVLWEYSMLKYLRF